MFFRINEASAAETSRLAWAAVAGVVACIYPIARAVKLTVPGDFLFFDDALLCYRAASVETLCAMELLR